MTSQPSTSFALAPPDRAGRGARTVVRWMTGYSLLALLTQVVGCAALTNPVANGVPVHMVPDELLAPSKEGYERVDLTQLRQSPPPTYLLEPGDTLGIYIEGVIGNPETPPPVTIPDSAEVPPSIGYPFPIRSSGSVSLPFIGEVEVAGLTIDEAERRVVEAYLAKKIVRQEDYRIIVSLLRPRYERVLVVRDDRGQSNVSVTNSSLVGFDTQTTISGGRAATGQVVELPAYENDLLNALARTGGLPGPDAVQEIVIYRGTRSGAETAAEAAAELIPPGSPPSSQQVRIPLQVPTGEALHLETRDIVLHTGDIVTVRARRPEFFYTGGLIPAAEHPLPFDRDMTVVEALLRARSPLLSGGLSTSNLNGAIVAPGMGNPSPGLVSLIRKTPDGSQINIRIDINEALRDPRQNILVQAEDILILQESTDEALTRYFGDVFQFDLFFRYLNRSDAVGSGAIVVP